jgi:hypothetical protein
VKYKGLTNEIFLRGSFSLLKTNLSDTIKQHLNKLEIMANKLDFIGTPILVEVKVKVLLIILLESYEFCSHVLRFVKVHRY